VAALAIAADACADEGGPALRPAAAQSAMPISSDRAAADPLATSAATGSSAGGSVLRIVGLPGSASRAAAKEADAVVESAEPVETIAAVEQAETLIAPIDGSPAVAAMCEADVAAGGEQAGDHELWIVSTRNLPAAKCGCPAPEFLPCVEQYFCGSGWRPSTLEEFLQGDDQARVTAVFIHGNDTDAAEAEARGRQLYRQLLVSPCPEPPTRLVIWSWPSEQVLRNVRRDAQLKACRTNIEGYYLARFVDRLTPQSPLSLGGYSYGARVVTGGLHLLGGGMLQGRQLDDRIHPERDAASVLLLGAAMSNGWLLPGMPHDRALSQTARLMILYNPADFVLHWYPRLWGRGGPEALGATGMAMSGRLGAERAKIVQINVRPQLHHQHGWEYVSASPWIMSLVRRELIIRPGAEAK
jgi:hypothetical protein